MNSALWSRETEAVVARAGWHPGRSVADRVARWGSELATEGGFELFPAASSALGEFGGLEFAASGAGVDFARGNVNIDPSLAIGEEDRFRELETRHGLKLFPLGEAYDGNLFLGIDPSGRVYLIDDELTLAGASIYRAIENLISGRREDSSAK